MVLNKLLLMALMGGKRGMMRMRENIGFWVAVAALLIAAASGIRSSGNSVSAQTAETRDCHYALAPSGTTWDGRWNTSGSTAGGRGNGNFNGRPWILLLDECTGNTWALNSRRGQWYSLSR